MATVIIGAGQAGLTVSHELSARGIDHVLVERSRVASAWRERWDAFTLVTPNWTLSLPGHPYAGDDPEGFVPRDAVVDHLQRYADGLAAEIREGVEVTALRAGPDGSFVLETSDGPIHATRVVVTTGAFQQPHLPAISGAFPPGTPLLDASSYRRPGDLPDGRILVVGSGQTGIQITEDLALAGREVVLACGRAPWFPRRLDGTDIVTWLARTPFFDQPVAALPSPEARFGANPQTTGRDGGHDLHYRVLAAMPGVQLAGHLAGVDGNTVRFADDLSASVAFGDDRWADIRALMTRSLGSEAPSMETPEPFSTAGLTEIGLDAIDGVLMTSGFRPDHARWVEFPVFDHLGFPRVDEDLRTEVPGLYFCGVHFLRTRRSAFLFGVGHDATTLATTIAADLAG